MKNINGILVFCKQTCSLSLLHTIYNAMLYGYCMSYITRASTRQQEQLCCVNSIFWIKQKQIVQGKNFFVEGFMSGHLYQYHINAVYELFNFYFSWKLSDPTGLNWSIVIHVVLNPNKFCYGQSETWQSHSFILLYNADFLHFAAIQTAGRGWAESCYRAQLSPALPSVLPPWTIMDNSRPRVEILQIKVTLYSLRLHLLYLCIWRGLEQQLTFPIMFN